jgi:DNA invertase Pin-like site-specific DNA recombinase
MQELVAYRRVSTVRQGESGLGLEAQDAAIQAYAKATGARIIGAYIEVETGKKDDMENRPELLRAIGHAKRAMAVLAIAKLDRLSRSVYVTATLHKADVDFICCDNPGANRMTIQILAVVAENEAKMISDRTKAALAVYKDSRRVSKRLREKYEGNVPQDVIDATAGRLGAALPQCRNLTDEGRIRGAAKAGRVVHQKATQAYTDLLPDMTQWRTQGMTLQAIAARLNDNGQTTRRKKPWNHMQVKRVLERA